MSIGDKVELIHRGEKVQGEVTEIKTGFVVVTDSLGKKYYVAKKISQMKIYHNLDHALSELTDEAEDRAKFLNDLKKAQGLKAAQEAAKGDPRVAYEANFKFFYARPDYVLIQVDKLFPK